MDCDGRFIMQEDAELVTIALIPCPMMKVTYANPHK